MRLTEYEMRLDKVLADYDFVYQPNEGIWLTSITSDIRYFDEASCGPDFPVGFYYYCSSSDKGILFGLDTIELFLRDIKKGLDSHENKP